MFAAKAGQRFSLLLLEEGESFVRDFVASADWPTSVSGPLLARRQLPGQLRLATKSLFFEPDDIRVPIVRLPFVGVQGMEGHSERTFELTAQRWTRMKANAADVPFAFEKGESGTATVWRFHLQHSTLADFMPLAQQMLVASRLPDAEQEEFLAALCAQQEVGVRFDVGYLRSPGDELVLAEQTARLITPLVQEPGRLALTNRHLYFQPLHNWSGDAAVYSHPLAAIAAVVRRRSSGLRDVGLEVFFAQPGVEEDVAGPFWGAASAFFAFAAHQQREDFLHELATQHELGLALAGGRELAAACSSVLEAESGWVDRVTAAWQRGQLSNFQYLLFLNAASGRTFNDLSQYPVFPWVLADYTSPTLDLSDPASFRDLSKPVGALTPRRLASLKQRYWDMPHDDPDDPPFLYATHYSTPGYVMFWTLRAAPAHMLRLQSGRFDAPDRLFASIPEAWKSVTTLPTDVKELIPEMFMADPAFLVNAKSLPLGVRQNGRPVGDVELPPWAASPAHFLALHRAALEAPCVSANLHHWIDLVFGYKSRGQAAVDSDNLFRHLASGMVDIESIQDPTERKALTTAIQEFGQSPKAIFHRPHVRRLVCPPPPAAEEAFGDAGAAGEAGGGQAVSLALVTAVVAAATETPSDPLEVPELLAELDVLHGKQEEAEESTPPSECDAASSLAEEGSELSSSPMPRQSPAARLKSLMGGVRQVVTSPADKATTSLRGLFASRKVASSSAQPAGSQEPQAEPAGREVVGSAPAPMTKSPSAGGLRSSLSSRWRALTNSGSRGSARSLSEQQAEANTPDTSNGARQLAESSADVAPPSASSYNGGVVWKVSSSRGSSQQRVRLPADEDSGSEEEVDHASPLPRPSWQQQDDAQTQPAEQQQPAQQWGPGLRDRLRPGHVFGCVEAVHATAVSAVGAQQFAYAALASGSLRVTDVTGSRQLRSAPLGSQPLSSLALLPLAGGDAATGSPGAHPLVLAGSYDCSVRAYHVETGRILGDWQAHSDTVSCLELVVPGGRAQPTQLCTASWDGLVCLADLQEGRQPWAAGGGDARVLADLGSGVWALAADAIGNLLLTGTEDGLLVLLDQRSSAKAWEQPLSDDYIGGVRFLPGSSEYAVVASGDATLSVLDMRRAGARLSYVACAAPLRCLATDGTLAMAGSEQGSLYLWDVAQQLGRAGPVGGRWSQAGPSGLYEPLEWAPQSAVNALDVRVLGREVVVAAGHEGGMLRTWAAPL